MKNNQVFRVNSPQVVCEAIDGEVVIVHLEKGYYYSLLKTGVDVWSRIESRTNYSSIIREITQVYDGSAEEIATAIDEFLENLQREELIIADSTTESVNTVNNTQEIAEITNKPRFEKPKLEKFTDMEDLLLLDPIHEVDVEAGWPSAKIA
ncbi:PqqD family protein [Fortiea contorta]|uniref:PqqD family protein n=1 Tax=Fortiea contorta TaxID=1892405 RepID=UPI00034A7F8B|nr:PqqD family protein [Fortiea contorta]